MRFAAFCVLTLSLLIPDASAQIPNPQQATYPSREYYLGLQLYRDGALGEAGEAFEQALRRARRDANGRWIDSIPSLAMLGEVQYQLGNLILAQEYFDTACELMLLHEASLASLDWPDRLQPFGGVRSLPTNWWGAGQVQTAMIPDRIQVGIGEISPERALRTGGAFQSAQIIAVDAVEVLRGAAIAAYRRGEILGPLAVDDRLTESGAAMAERMVARSGPVAAPLWQTIGGLWLAADDQSQPAAAALGRGMVVGNLAHPLSPFASLGIARLMRDDGQGEGLRRSAMEASISAALFDQTEWVAESLRIASGTLIAGGDEGLLIAATKIAEGYGRGARYLAAAASVVAADAAATAGNHALAATHLTRGQTVLRSRNSMMPRYEAYAAWVRSRGLAAGGKPVEALAAASQAVAFGRGNGDRIVGAPSLLQRQLRAASLAAGAVAGQKAEREFAAFLAPPSALHWARDGVDALSLAVADQTAIRAALLSSSVGRDDAEGALVAADAMLRSRLHAALPVGGRAVDLRWLVAGPMDALQGPAADLRKNLPGSLAALNHSQLEAEAIRKALADLSLRPDDAAAEEQSKKLWSDLARISAAMEGVTLSAALDRLPLPRVFPPAFREASSEEGAGGDAEIPEGAAIVTYVPVGNRWVGIAATSDRTTMWTVELSPAALASGITRLLTEIGVGRRRAGSPQLPADDAWRAQAVTLRDQVLPADKLPLDTIRRLVIVPSGPLWYFPFELFPEAGEDSDPIGQRIAISYAPTPGLAVAPPPDTSVGETVGYVTNRFFAPKVPEEEQSWVETLSELHEDSVSLPQAGAIPGRFISARLRAVWVAVAGGAPAGAAVMQYSPLQYDAKSGSGGLGDWMQFPWGAPRTVLLPGFRSQLRGDGSELFLTAFALQAAGSPQALVARWPVGGVSTATVLAEAVKEIESENLLSAWRRAVQVLRGTELNPTAEPLLSEGDRDRLNLTGDQPLFWSGYMVLQGLEPQQP